MNKRNEETAMNESTRNAAPRNAIIAFVVLVSAMIAVAVAKKSGMLDYDTAKRSVGVLFGCVLIGSGNLIPKFRLFEGLGRNPANVLAAERFAGWTFVLTGIISIGVWILLPMTDVVLISSVIGITSFSLVITDGVRRFGWRPSTIEPSANELALGKRVMLGAILVTIAWGNLIFLADHLWGDATSKWMAISYPIAISTLIPMALAREEKRSTIDKNQANANG